MPCFKGIAVSIHANNAPLPEYGLQKQSRVSRISAYVPVPQAKLNADAKTEPASFAISITLLRPGMEVPYSRPPPTASNPKPQPQYVSGLRRDSTSRPGNIKPYINSTGSENETIAAYIYFDGRPKEEVATLLRPGEETWVNSRWVLLPPSEGGGLAEREFLFREVSLEKWLNGLDLQGKDSAEKLEKRRQMFERRRRNQELKAEGRTNGHTNGVQEPYTPSDTFRYGADELTPEDIDDDGSDDELPEATGQIKVAMFRVLASGDVKRGEFSPQFGVNDDDEDDASKNQDIDGEVQHTTSFAQPKSLDPRSISTQTVTGIDGPDQPYAVFTFFYRGERQLQKMGIVRSRKGHQSTSSKTQVDFSNLGPLKPTGTVGFTNFRDRNAQSSGTKKSKVTDGGDMVDSDEDNDDAERATSKLDAMIDDDKDVGPQFLAPEDARSQGELAEGLNRIRLKRQHSEEPDGSHKLLAAGEAFKSTSARITGIPEEIGSPMKKHRSDAPSSSKVQLPSGFAGDVLAKAEAAKMGMTLDSNRSFDGLSLPPKSTTFEPNLDLKNSTTQFDRAPAPDVLVPDEEL